MGGVCGKVEYENIFRKLLAKASFVNADPSLWQPGQKIWIYNENDGFRLGMLVGELPTLSNEFHIEVQYDATVNNDINVSREKYNILDKELQFFTGVSEKDVNNFNKDEWVMVIENDESAVRGKNGKESTKSVNGDSFQVKQVKNGKVEVKIGPDHEDGTKEVDAVQVVRMKKIDFTLPGGLTYGQKVYHKETGKEGFVVGKNVDNKLRVDFSGVTTGKRYHEFQKGQEVEILCGRDKRFHKGTIIEENCNSVDKKVYDIRWENEKIIGDAENIYPYKIRPINDTLSPKEIQLEENVAGRRQSTQSDKDQRAARCSAEKGQQAVAYSGYERQNYDPKLLARLVLNPTNGTNQGNDVSGDTKKNEDVVTVSMVRPEEELDLVADSDSGSERSPVWQRTLEVAKSQGLIGGDASCGETVREDESDSYNGAESSPNALTENQNRSTPFADPELERLFQQYRSGKAVQLPTSDTGGEATIKRRLMDSSTVAGVGAVATCGVAILGYFAYRVHRFWTAKRRPQETDSMV